MEGQQYEESNVPSKEQKRSGKRELARAIIREAVLNEGIKDISEYNGEPLTQRWHIFSANHGEDVVLRMYVQGVFGEINADVSLLTAAGWAIDEIELVLGRPKATELFNFTDEERPDLLRENARMIVEQLIRLIPIIFYPLISTALRQSIEAHVNTHVKRLLAEHWQSLGQPEGFTISPSTEFMHYSSKIDEQFKGLIKGALGDKRAWLTTERREHLDEEHEQLRVEYQAAKDYYGIARKAFFLGKRNRTDSEWDEEWMTTAPRMFPNLLVRCLSEINSYQPFELAHLHLGERYDYSPQYIAKLVCNASSSKRSRNVSKRKKSE